LSGCKWIEPEERRLVWLRAERVRWKLICARMGVGRTKAWEMYRRALARIASRSAAYPWIIKNQPPAKTAMK
jgi:hypothetical protein